MPQLRRFRIKGRENPWFSSELADIHEHNLAWAKSRKTGSPTVWLLFRQLKNKWTSFNKKAKSEYYLPVTTENQNIQINQKNKKQIKEFLENHLVLSVNKSSHALLTYFFLKDSVPVYNRKQILNFLNKHFIFSGSFLTL